MARPPTDSAGSLSLPSPPSRQVRGSYGQATPSWVTTVPAVSCAARPAVAWAKACPVVVSLDAACAAADAPAGWTLAVATRANSRPRLTPDGLDGNPTGPVSAVVSPMATT